MMMMIIIIVSKVDNVTIKSLQPQLASAEKRLLLRHHFLVRL